ncbi:DNA-binding protein [Escherichia coli]|uniref:helix-turn-helix domain-containing protein n=1 Tax=Escherichia coli TaxID=562 RepID=UPI003FCF6481
MSHSDATGKLIETSELIRCYGEIKQSNVTPEKDMSQMTMSHDVTLLIDKNESEIELLKQQVALLQQRLQDKDEHISSLKQAILLIESKLPTTREPVTPPVGKKSWQFWKK